MTSIINADTVKPARSSSQKRQWRVAATVLAVSIGIGAIAYPYVVPQSKQTVVSDYDTAMVVAKDLQRTAQASGSVQIPVQMIVPAPQGGYTAELYVSVGDTVEKNQVIAQISVPDLDETIEDLKASLTTAKLSRERTLLNYQNDVENSEANILALQDNVSDIEVDVAKYEALVKINAARQTDLDDLNDSLKDAQTQLSDAQRSLRQTHALHEIDLKASDASISQIETQLARALVEKEEANIKSPMAGEILEVADELSVPGSSVEQGTELITIAAPESAVFSLEISEEYASSIAIGDQVPVTVGSSVIQGEITFIGKVASTSSDGLGATIQVTVKPVTENSSLLLGSTAIGVFTPGVEEDALTLPRGAYLTTGSQKYVYVVEGSTAHKTNVTYGEIIGNTVQINSGLAEGDVVITSGYQNFISESDIKLGE